jgi:hypothetical protein
MGRKNFSLAPTLTGEVRKFNLVSKLFFYHHHAAIIIVVSIIIRRWHPCVRDYKYTHLLYVFAFTEIKFSLGK